MTFLEFEPGFRSLCLAFGLSYSEGRCKVYHEQLQNLDQLGWQRLVTRWKKQGAAFPKISDLVRSSEFEHATEPAKRDERLEWLRSDCVAKECIEGLIHVGEYKGQLVPLFGPEALEGLVFERELSYRCTKCRRGDVDYPKMPLWRGTYTIREGKEMSERLQERRDILAQGGQSIFRTLGRML